MAKQVVIIGGGAAGMLAAVSAAERGASVTVLDPNERLGKKLNITGKGRCNLTNDADTETVLANVPRNGRFLYSALSRFGPRDVMAYFESLGVPLKVERGNRVFPVSDRAFDVSGALERRMRKLGVRWIQDRALSIETKPLEVQQDRTDVPDRTKDSPPDRKEKARRYEKAASAVWGERDTYPADAVILATGGVSYPATGSTGEGHRMARELGHTVTPLRGSLVPLREAGNLCARMQGLSLRNVQLTAWERKTAPAKYEKREAGFAGHTDEKRETSPAGQTGGEEKSYPDGQTGGKKEKRVYQGFGELLFTHFGVSGPLVLSASAHMRRFEDRVYRLEIDLKPALDVDTLDRRLVSDLAKYANHDFSNSLDDLLPRKLIPVLVELTGIPPERKARDLTREERRRVLDLLKRFPVPIAGPRPVTEAIVTSGGVCVKEVDPASMESKYVKGLYFAGEILDVDAYTGGFNLQIAWCTGRAAGIAAAEQGVSYN